MHKGGAPAEDGQEELAQAPEAAAGAAAAGVGDAAKDVVRGREEENDRDSRGGLEEAGGGKVEKETKLEMTLDEIVPGLLYLSSMEEAQNIDVLRKFGITHILTVGGGMPALFNQEFSYQIVGIDDHPDALLIEKFESCFSFIEHAQAQDGRVLVHCEGGVSRSASICAAYLMFVGEPHPTAAEAIEHLQSIRSRVSPNTGFRAQLKLFEELQCNPDMSRPEAQSKLDALVKKQASTMAQPSTLTSLLKPDLFETPPENYTYEMETSSKASQFINTILTEQSALVSKKKKKKAMGHQTVSCDDAALSDREDLHMTRPQFLGDEDLDKAPVQGLPVHARRVSTLGTITEPPSVLKIDPDSAGLGLLYEGEEPLASSKSAPRNWVSARMLVSGQDSSDDEDNSRAATTKSALVPRHPASKTSPRNRLAALQASSGVPGKTRLKSVAPLTVHTSLDSMKASADRPKSASLVTLESGSEPTQATTSAGAASGRDDDSQTPVNTQGVHLNENPASETSRSHQDGKSRSVVSQTKPAKSSTPVLAAGVQVDASPTASDKSTQNAKGVATTPVQLLSIQERIAAGVTRTGSRQGSLRRFRTSSSSVTQGSAESSHETLESEGDEDGGNSSAVGTASYTAEQEVDEAFEEEKNAATNVVGKVLLGYTMTPSDEQVVMHWLAQKPKALTGDVAFKGLRQGLRMMRRFVCIPEDADTADGQDTLGLEGLQTSLQHVSNTLEDYTGFPLHSPEFMRMLQSDQGLDSILIKLETEFKSALEEVRACTSSKAFGTESQAPTMPATEDRGSARLPGTATSGTDADLAKPVAESALTSPPPPSMGSPAILDAMGTSQATSAAPISRPSGILDRDTAMPELAKDAESNGEAAVPMRKLGILRKHKRRRSATIDLLLLLAKLGLRREKAGTVSDVAYRQFSQLLEGGAQEKTALENLDQSSAIELLGYLESFPNSIKEDMRIHRLGKVVKARLILMVAEDTASDICDELVAQPCVTGAIRDVATYALHFSGALIGTRIAIIRKVRKEIASTKVTAAFRGYEARKSFASRKEAIARIQTWGRNLHGESDAGAGGVTESRVAQLAAEEATKAIHGSELQSRGLGGRPARGSAGKGSASSLVEIQSVKEGVELDGGEHGQSGASSKGTPASAATSSAQPPLPAARQARNLRSWQSCDPGIDSVTSKLEQGSARRQRDPRPSTRQLKDRMLSTLDVASHFSSKISKALRQVRGESTHKLNSHMTSDAVDANAAQSSRHNRRDSSGLAIKTMESRPERPRSAMYPSAVLGTQQVPQLLGTGGSRRFLPSETAGSVMAGPPREGTRVSFSDTHSATSTNSANTSVNSSFLLGTSSADGGRNGEGKVAAINPVHALQGLLKHLCRVVVSGDLNGAYEKQHSLQQLQQHSKSLRAVHPRICVADAEERPGLLNLPKASEELGKMLRDHPKKFGLNQTPYVYDFELRVLVFFPPCEFDTALQPPDDTSAKFRKILGTVFDLMPCDSEALLDLTETATLSQHASAGYALTTMLHYIDKMTKSTDYMHSHHLGDECEGTSGSVAGGYVRFSEKDNRYIFTEESGHYGFRWTLPGTRQSLDRFMHESGLDQAYYLRPYFRQKSEKPSVSAMAELFGDFAASGADVSVKSDGGPSPIPLGPSPTSPGFGTQTVPSSSALPGSDLASKSTASPTTDGAAVIQASPAGSQASLSVGSTSPNSATSSLPESALSAATVPPTNMEDLEWDFDDDED
ncbi:Dual specificity protein phosphatase 19 (Protein phosphatase SKRP1) (Stress-activated protein kinase pathway-regulating phosphatase 1) [Durusdinium trenchii]|uniref:Dual specificity protein phosphatase 19 (Protein phosphatase SKRP1) (Stress-activated protein kinase pathway-regulating phosphatase 1) n=1 Tax=Durusdinium trenchii TaxID=1381693 RepID=A0ABP0H767_9DINO